MLWDMKSSDWMIIIMSAYYCLLCRPIIYTLCGSGEVVCRRLQLICVILAVIIWTKICKKTKEKKRWVETYRKTEFIFIWEFSSFWGFFETPRSRITYITYIFKQSSADKMLVERSLICRTVSLLLRNTFIIR